MAIEIRTFGIFGVYNDDLKDIDFSGGIVWNRSTGRISGNLYDRYGTAILYGSMSLDSELKFDKVYLAAPSNPINYQLEKMGDLWLGRYSFAGRERDKSGAVRGLLFDTNRLGHLPNLEFPHSNRPGAYGSWFEGGLAGGGS